MNEERLASELSQLMSTPPGTTVDLGPRLRTAIRRAHALRMAGSLIVAGVIVATAGLSGLAVYPLLTRLLPPITADGGFIWLPLMVLAALLMLALQQILAAVVDW